MEVHKQSAKPVYNLFVEAAKEMNPEDICMIIPADNICNTLQ